MTLASDDVFDTFCPGCHVLCGGCTIGRICRTCTDDRNEQTRSRASTYPTPEPPIPILFGLPFSTGIDLVIPAMPPAPVDVSLKSRGKGPKRTLNFPNYPSATHRVSLHFQAIEQKY